jgi:hypothetical protein
MMSRTHTRDGQAAWSTLARMSCRRDLTSGSRRAHQAAPPVVPVVDGERLAYPYPVEDEDESRPLACKSFLRSRHEHTFGRISAIWTLLATHDSRSRQLWRQRQFFAEEAEFSSSPAAGRSGSGRRESCGRCRRYR